MRSRHGEIIWAGVNVRVWVHDLRTGAVRLHDAGHNLVTDAGLNIIRDRVRGVAATGELTHMAVGTDDTAVTAGDTTLGAEVHRDTFTEVNLSAATMVIRTYIGPNDANGSTLEEAGLFNHPSAGSMYARRLFSSPIVKTADVAVTVEWELTWAAV
jgi:hypothetical protein